MGLAICILQAMWNMQFLLHAAPVALSVCCIRFLLRAVSVALSILCMLFLGHAVFVNFLVATAKELQIT